MPDRIPTLADVCSAIAEGQVAVDSDGHTYQVNALELRRYFSQRRSLPLISLLDVLSSAYTDAHDWTHFDICGLGR
jgi:hypothetical protein